MELDCRRILDAFSDAVVAADRDGRIAYANRKAEALLGWGQGELSGQPLVAIIPERLREVHRGGFHRYLTTREARLIGHPVRVPALCRDGSELEIELTLAAFHEPAGDLFVASLRDLAERIELERQLTVTRYLRAATAAAAKLTSHLDLQSVLDTVVETLVREFDAALARIWLYHPETRTLRLRASAGLSTQVDASSRAVIDVATYPYKVGVIARTRRPFVRNGLEGEADFDGEWVEREGLRAVAGFPLLVGGELRGVFIYFSRQELPPEVVEVLGTFAAIVAASLNDVQLFEREQAARREAEAAQEAAEAHSAALQLANEELQSQQEELQQVSQELQSANEELQSQQSELEQQTEALREQQRRTKFLAEASLILGSSLDYETTLRSVARLAVPEIGEWCAIDVADEAGWLRRLAVTHVDPAKVALVQEIHEKYPPRRDDAHGAPHVLRTGEPELYPEIGDEVLMAVARDAEHLRILRELGLVSGLVVPLTARGQVLGVLTLVSAESGRRYAPEDLRFAQELARRAALAVDNARLHSELHEANRQKDRFLAMLAHELRNPLAAVANAGHVLEGLDLQPAQAARLTRIVNRQTAHLSRMVDDLLDVARISRGNVDLQEELVELGAVVERAVETARPLVDARQHRVELALPEQPVRLLADATRLEQVVVNLLNNAAKYTEPGGRISVSAAREADEAVLRVRDNGIGIPAGLLPRVFDLFTQGDQTLARTGGGLGIGLTLVKSLVELHGGSVSARSEGPGRGSEFEVRLPALREARLPDASGTLPAGGASRPLRVVVVDDSPDSAETLGDLLQLWDHKVEVAYHGAGALAAAASFRPQVVLCDLGLPGMDGYEVAAALRQAPETAAARLIAVTGYGGPEVSRRCREAGFDLHLTKPVEPEMLRAALQPPSVPRAPE